MSDCCGCEKLEARTLADKERRVLITVLAINVGTFLMMVAGSILSGSSALLSGTLDNFGDAVTLPAGRCEHGVRMGVFAQRHL